MCGIVGFLDKRGGTDRPVGRTLLGMLRALSCRGPDSAGVAVFGPPQPFWMARVAIRGSAPAGCPPLAEIGEDIRRMLDGMADVRRLELAGVNLLYLEAEARAGADVLEEALLACRGVSEVLCVGKRLELFKMVGSPDHLETISRLSQRVGSHGIGHTRLSTESRVDLSHSQPFWAHGVPDLATAHNGHITNYHKLRRHYEQRGYRFFTENDSEVIGVYLRDRLAAGLSLEDALRSSLDDFDGSFSYLAAGGNCLAYVRDRFGFKPLVVAETDAFVAVATEEIALRAALGGDFVAREPAPGSMQVWPVPAAPAALAHP
jgi:glutamine phosphoribosylpyrophosphate amidotransferase